MWSEDEDVHAALRGDFADPSAEVNWGRIIAGAVVLTIVALLAIGVAIMGAPAPTV